MRRIRDEDDGSQTIFEPLTFEAMGPYRAEVQVASLEELRELKRLGKLIALRMVGTPRGKVTQRNLVPWEEIEDFDWSG